MSLPESNVHAASHGLIVIVGDFQQVRRPSNGWTCSVHHLDAKMRGDILLSEADGRFGAIGTEFIGPHGAIQIIGAWNASATLGGDIDRWSMAGMAKFAAKDAETIWGIRPSIEAGAAAVGLGALGFIAWLGYNRVSKRRAGEHPVRRQVLATLAEAPGITTNELTRRIEGASRGSVRHHLDKLISVGLVSRFERGPGGNALALNSERAEFTMAASGSGEHTRAWELFQLMQSPAYGNILKALGEMEAPSYQEVAQWLENRGLPVPSQGSTWSRCIARLSHLGALEKFKRRGVIYYHLSVDLNEWHSRYREGITGSA